ncbi:MAG: S-layer homology domain-containing protein, partial [Syntrophomonas sp.]|nr:S-layer homology domain-containing protein [Syntrophomonas sp.]
MIVKKETLMAGLIAFIAINLFCVLILTTPTAAVETIGLGGEDKAFTDLSNSNPNFNYIRFLSQRGIIAGFPDGRFQPEESLSRAQAAVMLVKAMGLEATPTNENIFRDVEKDHWASSYIATCVKAGYIKGYPDGSYKPEEKLSRAQGISLVLRLSKQDMNRASLPQIEDVNHEHWAAQHIATGLAAEMVGLDSSGKKFLPDNPFSRQEMCRVLGMLLTQDPDHYACELKGKLVVESGEIILKRAGQSRKVEKSEVVEKGDIIESGPGGSAVINYSDGSSILIKENSVISIIDSRGRKYIMKDGSPSMAVDWLNFKIDKGIVFTALAARAAETGQEKAEENKTAGLTTLLAASDSSRYIAAAEKSTPPWYKTAQQKKVKVKVDMPYGVAAVRGTFIMISIGSDGQCNVSCLSGSAELSGGGGTVNLNGGQSSGLTQSGAPPQPPAPMTQQQQQLFQQVQQWVQQTQQQIQQFQENPPTPPPPAGSPPGQQQQQQQQQQTQQQSSNTSSDSGGGGGGPVIQSIADISVRVGEDSPFELPAVVTAIMSNGSSRQLTVKWDTSNIDTSRPGQVTVNGKVDGYAGTVKLLIIVEKKSSNEARLQGLDLLGCNMEPAFNAETSNYFARMSNSTESVTVSCTPMNAE